jgi:signal transduction histidine kinase
MMLPMPIRIAGLSLLLLILVGAPTILFAKDMRGEGVPGEKQANMTTTQMGGIVEVRSRMPDNIPFSFTRLRGYALWENRWEFHPASPSTSVPPPPQSSDWIPLSSVLFPLEHSQPAFWNGAGWFRLRLQYRASDHQESLPLQFTLAFQIVGSVTCYLDGSPVTSVGTPATPFGVERLAPFGYYHLHFYDLALQPDTTHELLCYYTFSPVQYQRSLGGFRSSPPLGMHIALTTPEEVHGHNQAVAFFWFFFQGVIGSVIIIGIIHLLLYLGGEHYRVNAIIALFTLFVTTQSFSFYFLNFALGQPLWVIFLANTVLVVAAPLSLLLIVVLLKELFGQHIRISLLFASLLTLTAILLSLVRTPPGSQYLWVMNLISGLCVLALVSYVLLKIVRLYRLHVPEIGLTTWSIIFFTAAFLNEVIFSFRNEFHFRRPFWSVALLLGLYLPIPFALSVTVTRRLLSLRDQLRKSNTELEQRVEERTVQLTTANEEIERQLEILNEQSKEIEIANTELQERNMALEELDMEKNEFLGIAAHDLKNPLTSIRMTADLVLRYGDRMSEEEQRERLHVILTVSERMTAIITNLLEINAIERGGITLTITAIDIMRIVQAGVMDYEHRAREKNITLHCEGISSPVWVDADEQAIVQVLDNLLSNAVKYSPHGKNVYVRVVSRAEAVRVEVQDEGEGISPQDMKKLFGKFARLSARPTGGEHSTGLGLSIAKKMVEAMNGRVWCESEFGKGATFIVEFPCV